ncbi:MAG: sugar phosphate isomerase/epimerase family protein [Rhodomicrobiaceae bacterium]
MKLALCNEVIREKGFAAQCAFAATLGYDGLEVAPFTLSGDPGSIDAGERAKLRRMAADAGIAITGLHWLLVTPEGLSITTPDAAVHKRTVAHMEAMALLCADLGGSVLVHGSPKQRATAPGDDPAETRARAIDAFAAAAKAAESAGVTYCLEPLARNETDFVNTVAEAVEIVKEIGSPAFKTMIDTSAAGQAEERSVSELIREWLPSGHIAHVQLNDTNRKAPGQGSDDFAAITTALREVGYDGVAAVEPFIYEPDGAACAAWAAGYLRGLDLSLRER